MWSKPEPLHWLQAEVGAILDDLEREIGLVEFPTHSKKLSPLTEAWRRKISVFEKLVM